MSKRPLLALCLALLLPVSGPFAQEVLPVKPFEDPGGLPPEIVGLVWKAQEAQLEGRYHEAIDAAGEFLTYTCDDHRTIEVLRVLTTSVRAEPGLRDAADHVLRTALAKHPFARNIPSVQAAVSAIHTFSLSEWDREDGQCIVPDEATSFRLSRRGGPPSTFTLWRIHEDLRSGHFGQLPIDDIQSEIPDLPLLAACRDRWEQVNRWTAAFPEKWDLEALPERSRLRSELVFDRPGLYVLEEEIEGFTACHPFVVHGFVAMARSVGDSRLLFVANPWTGEPVPGVRVRARFKESAVNGTTGTDGTFTFEGAGDGLLLCEFGGETAIQWIRESSLDDVSICHLAPDRPLYRPGDLIHFRTVWRWRRDGRLIPPAGEPVQVFLRSPGEEGEQVREGKWSDLGTFSGTFALPENATPGSWSLRVVSTEGEDRWTSGAYRRIGVAEFERPEVRLSVEIDPNARLLGEPVRAVVRAEHWWGAPAAGIPLTWEAWGHREGRAFWQRRPFPDPRAWFYGGDSPLWYQDGSEQGGEGEGVTGADGTFVIEFPTTLGDGPIGFGIEAVLMPPSGRAVETYTNVTAWPARVRVRVGADRMFAEPGQEVRATAAVIDQDGRPVANRAVKLAVLRGDVMGRMVEYVPFRMYDAITGDDGRVLFTFRPPEAARLRLKAMVPDGKGRTAVHRADLLIASPPDSGPEDEADTLAAEENDDGILMIPDRAAHASGETARILVDGPTGIPLLLTVAGDRFHESHIVRLERRRQIVEVKIDPTWVPNVYVRLFGLSGESYEKERIHTGGCELLVLPQEGPVDVEVRTDQGSYGLREEAELTVVTTRNGEPVAAEVQIAVVDEAIFALVNEDPASIDPDLTPNLASIFWASVEDEDTLSAPSPPYPGWMELVDQWARWISTFRNYHPGFGFGEGKSPAAAGYAPAELRSWLPDTLLWRGSLTTDENGRASVPFTTPDRLTNWRVVARAVAGDEAFGEGRSAMGTAKAVAVRIGAPRSLTETDEGTVAVSVRSDLDEPAEFLLRLVVSGPAEGGGERKVSVAAGGDASVLFPLRGLGAGTVVLHAEALSTTESDAIEKEIPGVAWFERQVIRREAVAAPQAVIEVEDADAFEVRVQSPSDLARELAPHVLDWKPRQDPEEYAWRMMALLATDRLPTEEDAMRLALTMGEDGSFHSGHRKPQPTPEAVHALMLAKEAGLPVPAAVLEMSRAWLERIGGAATWSVPAYSLPTILELRAGGFFHSPLDTARVICALSALGGGEHAEPEITRGDGRIVVRAGDDIPLLVTATRHGEAAAPPPLTPLAEGISVERVFERFNGKAWHLLDSGEPVAVGDELRCTLTMRCGAKTPDVAVTCPLPGGAVAKEPGSHSYLREQWFKRAEFHLDRVVLGLIHLPVNRCTFTFMLRPVRPGTWHVGPARAVSESNADHRGRSGAFVLEVR